MLFKKYAPGGFIIMTETEKQKELAAMVEKLVAALENVQIAADDLRESYGVEVLNVGIFGRHRVRIRNGIDALAFVTGREVHKINVPFIKKDFTYGGVLFTQLSEGNGNSTEFAEIDDDGKALWKMSPYWKI